MATTQREYEERTRKKLVLITLAAILLLVLMAGIVVFERQNSLSAAKTPISEDAYRHFPMLGTGNAPVRMLEFADFKCPFCKRWSSDIFPLLKRDYIDTGKVDFYFGNMPILSEDSVTAALAAESVYKQNPSIFWSYERLLYENMPDEKRSWDSESLIQIAKSNNLPIDLDRLENDILKQPYKEEIAMQKKIGQTAGVSRVPSLFLNGKPVSGDYEELKKIIDLEIKRKGGES